MSLEVAGVGRLEGGLRWWSKKFAMLSLTVAVADYESTSRGPSGGLGMIPVICRFGVGGSITLYVGYTSWRVLFLGG